jgi:hypothetical protein
MEFKAGCGSVFFMDSDNLNLYNEARFYLNKIYYKGNLIKIYVVISIAGKTDFLHRYLLNPDKGMEVDHINGNGLDNRLLNLRVCTKSQNGANRKSSNKTSKYKGVSLCSSSVDKKWRAQITKNGKCVLLGRYYTEKEAAKAYDKQAIITHKDFAKTNKDLGLL